MEHSVAYIIVKVCLQCFACRRRIVDLIFVYVLPCKRQPRWQTAENRGDLNLTTAFWHLPDFLNFLLINNSTGVVEDRMTSFLDRPSDRLDAKSPLHFSYAAYVNWWHLSVCYTLESLDLESPFLRRRYIFRIVRSSSHCRVNVKVTGAKVWNRILTPPGFCETCRSDRNCSDMQSQKCLLNEHAVTLTC